MPTGYVKKLAKKHKVSTRAAEGKWKKAKKAASKEGHKEDYGYVTSIFKKMMHEKTAMFPLKDLVEGFTFGMYMLAEELGETIKTPTTRDYLENFPSFAELPFRAKKQIVKDIDELGVDVHSLSPEIKSRIDAYIEDLIIDKTQELVGKGLNIGPGEEDPTEARRRVWDMEQELADFEKEKEVAPVRRKEREPRHIAAMRGPIAAHFAADEPEISKPSVSPEEGGEGQTRRSYYKPYSDLTPEQLLSRKAISSKHSLKNRLTKTGWFINAFDPVEQDQILDAINNGEIGSTEDVARYAIANSIGDLDSIPSRYK